MIIAIPKEARAGETRVAATPETVKKLKALGLDIAVETGAGAAARIAFIWRLARQSHRTLAPRSKTPISC
jgi:hypothetical protein